MEQPTQPISRTLVFLNENMNKPKKGPKKPY